MHEKSRPYTPLVRTLGGKKQQFLDCKQPNPFQNLQRQHPNLSLADEINDFFVSVSEHLPPFKNDHCSTIIADYTQDYIILPA